MVDIPTGGVLSAVPQPQIVQERLLETRREEALLRRLLELAKRVHEVPRNCKDDDDIEKN